LFAQPRHNGDRAYFPRLFSISGLALMPHSQNSNHIVCGIEPIEGEISGCFPRDDELANVIVYSSPDERMRFENADCAFDALQNPCGSVGRSLQQKLDNAFKFGECLVGIDYL